MSSEKTIRYEDFDTTDGIKVAGHANSLWGLSWSPSDLSDANFRAKVRLAGRESTGVDDLAIDHIAVKVFHEATSGGSTATTTSYMHTDHLGSTNAVTDEDGILMQTLDYYPYGSLRTDDTTLVDEKHKFTGHEFDRETELTYAGARYYDQDIGRWVALDPASRDNPNQFLSDPQQLNTYSYGRNNPLGYIDPNGEDIYWYSDGTLARQTPIGNNQYFESADIRMLRNNAGVMQNNRLNVGLFISNVREGGDWDFKQYGREYFFFDGKLAKKEDFGNLHYGYVGTAGGFGENILTDAGGFVQVAKCDEGNCNTKPWYIGTNYDDPLDTDNIRKGASFYNQSGASQMSKTVAKATDTAYVFGGGQGLSRTLNSLYYALKALSNALGELNKSP